MANEQDEILEENENESPKSKAKKKAEGDTINLRDKITVYSTDKDKFHDTGSGFKAHPKLADSLIARGLATKEKPGGNGKKKTAEEKQKS